MTIINRLKSKSPILLLFLCLVGIACIIFLPYLLKLRLFIFDADQLLEYHPFYEQWNRMIDAFLEDGIMPFYSLNSFLGNDFFASKAFYLTGDWLFPIVRLFSDLKDGLMVETIICFLTGGLGFGLWAKAFGIESKKLIILGGITYALSSMAGIFTGVYMFYRFYMFMPYVFLGLEYYRLHKCYWVLPLASCISFLNCYYFMFPMAFMMVVYFIFTYKYHDTTIKIPKILLNSLGAIGLFLLGFMMSGILTIPAIMNVLNNPRVGSSGDLPWYIPFDHHVLFSFLSGFITPGVNVSTSVNYLFDSGYDGHLSRFSTFLSIIPSLIALSLFHRKTVKQDKVTVIRMMMVAMTIVLLIKPINMVFHGLSEPSFRWVFIPLSIFLIISLETMDKGYWTKEALVKTTKWYLIVLIISFIVILIVDQVDIEAFGFNILLIIGCIILTILLVRYVYIHGLTNLIIGLSIIISIVTYSARLFIASMTFYPYTDSLDGSVISWYDGFDEEDRFYRVYVDPDKLMPSSPMNLNQSLHYNYRSTMAYDSTYEQNLNDFLIRNGIDWNRLLIDDPEVLRMLGVKYYYVTDESELPDGYDYTYAYNINHYKVYKQEEYRPIGFTYTKYVDGSTSDIDWNNVLLLEDELYELIESSSENHSIDFDLVDYRNDNYLYGEITVDQPSILFMSIPYNEGWMALDGDKQIDIHRVQGGFIGVVLEPGEHDLTFIFSSPGYSIGNKLTLVGGVGYIGMIVYCGYRYYVKRKRH